MSHRKVDSVLKAIESLSDEERDVLDARLAELDEAKWQQEASQVRTAARERGIDQAQIDKTIERLRYG